MDRIDKILSNMGFGTRKEVKAIIKSGEVMVGGNVLKDSGFLVNTLEDEIRVYGEELEYTKYIYLMMNKPAGVVSATIDNHDKTVIDLLEEKHAKFKPFLVGRLDKDTVGLILITNDGEMNHRLISPKWHVDKVYFARVKGSVDDETVKTFLEGVTIDDEGRDYKCMPAKLEILKVQDEITEVKVTLQEGKFHQVKKMFLAAGGEVTYLKRIRFGNIDLDPALVEGNYRELSKNEISYLKSV